MSEQRERFEAWAEEKTNLERNPDHTDIYLHLHARLMWKSWQAACPDVDDLAEHIRRVDGSHNMGAGALAESICNWLSAAPKPEDV